MSTDYTRVSNGDVVRFVESNPKWDLFESVKGWQKAELEINNVFTDVLIGMRSDLINTHDAHFDTTILKIVKNADYIIRDFCYQPKFSKFGGSDSVIDSLTVIKLAKFLELCGFKRSNYPITWVLGLRFSPKNSKELLVMEVAGIVKTNPHY